MKKIEKIKAIQVAEECTRRHIASLNLSDTSKSYILSEITTIKLIAYETLNELEDLQKCQQSKCDINQLVLIAVEEAKKHPKFHSRHEAWAVLKEELEEMVEEVIPVIDAMDVLWKSVRHDDASGFMSDIALIHDKTKLAIQEALQVMAVCRKYASTVVDFEEFKTEKT